MQPDKESLLDLFNGKKRYVVPLFQRQYVWTRENQWEPLWEDIQRKFLEKLFQKDGPAHFLGAMVIQQREVSGNEVPTHLVIDGQQRLTTFQIFIAAFRDVCLALGETEFADDCEDYLVNKRAASSSEEQRYKVWPTNLDRPSFSNVIDAKSKEALEKQHPLVWAKYARKPKPRHLIIECYLYFYNQISELLREELPELAVHEKVTRLFEALRNALQVITIEIDDRDDPQVIFETLNARGQPLLPSDLLRNFIFLRAAQKNESSEDLYNRYWLAFDDPFWRAEEKQGRLNRPRSDIFLQHYLSLKRKDEVNIGHLFAEYKYWITNKKPFNTVGEELADMELHRGFFRRLLEPENGSAFGDFARTLHALDIRTIYPLVLEILSRTPAPELLGKILIALESYIVRRAICNLTTKNYNRTFLSIVGKLTSDLTIESFQKILMEQQGDSTVWPRDDVFQKAWLENSVFDSMGSGRVQWILQQIECFMSSGARGHLRAQSTIFVEHIMPQDWIENWPLENGKQGVRWFERTIESERQAEIKASILRDKISESFGNLTLVTKPLGTSLSNAKYEPRKSEILENSNFALSMSILDAPEWSEEHIFQRGQRLFECAKKIWPMDSNNT